MVWPDNSDSTVTFLFRVCQEVIETAWPHSGPSSLFENSESNKKETSMASTKHPKLYMYTILEGAGRRLWDNRISPGCLQSMCSASDTGFYISCKDSLSSSSAKLRLKSEHVISLKLSTKLTIMRPLSYAFQFIVNCVCSYDYKKIMYIGVHESVVNYLWPFQHTLHWI